MTTRNSLSSGFEGRIPQTDTDVDEALQNGLLSLDANVLLSFYRYSPNARDALLDVLRAAGERVWVSHQAAREFWRNRISAITDRSKAMETLHEALSKSKTALGSAVDAWAKQTAVPEDVRKQVVNVLDSAIDEASAIVTADEQGAGPISYDGSNDPILDVLKDLLSSHVGLPLPEEEHKEALAEAKRRVENRVPPGFADSVKDNSGTSDGSSGDYLVWLQSMKEAVARDCPLVIVTGDEKEDWWWRHRSHLLGPRSELVEEFRCHSAMRLYLLRPVQLIAHAEALHVTVPKDAAADVARATGESGTSWTRRAVLELLRRLEAEGQVQAEIIRAAAEFGGSIDREDIYSIAEYDEARMLRGFTRPTARIARDLQNEGVLSSDVQAALTPIYENGVTALRFEVPEEFVEILGTDGEESM